jgi:solute carrier family 25 citrate transporter 1
MADPLDIPKYRNAGHAAYTIVKEEGVSALYKGVTLTALRQGKGQSIDFLTGAICNDLTQHMSYFQPPIRPSTSQLTRK